MMNLDKEIKWSCGWGNTTLINFFALSRFFWHLKEYALFIAENLNDVFMTLNWCVWEIPNSNLFQNVLIEISNHTKSFNRTINCTVLFIYSIYCTIAVSHINDKLLSDSCRQRLFLGYPKHFTPQIITISVC